MAEMIESGDIGNAERLVQWHGQNLRYCPGPGWYVWDGTRWARDGGGRVIELAKATVKRFRREARSKPVKSDDDGAGVRRRRQLIQQALSAGYAGRLNAMVYLAQSDPSVRIEPDQLDADPWLLNVQNGILDLRTGKVRRHCRDNLLTKLVPIAYRPGAECPTWDRFLKEIMAGDDGASAVRAGLGVLGWVCRAHAATAKYASVAAQLAASSHNTVSLYVSPPTERGRDAPRRRSREARRH